MGGARALIASLGASISLVAGAALSLLVVSFVFAYDGLVGEVGETRAQAALRVKVQAPQTARSRESSRDSAPVVVRVQAPKPASTVVATGQARGLRDQGATRTRRPVGGTSGFIDPGTPTAPPVASEPAPRDPTTGDEVRDLGDAVSGTVQNTGQAAGQAAAPLGPPVTQAVQDVLNLVASLLEGATGAVGATVDTLTGQR